MRDNPASDSAAAPFEADHVFMQMLIEPLNGTGLQPWMVGMASLVNGIADTARKIVGAEKALEMHGGR